MKKEANTQRAGLACSPLRITRNQIRLRRVKSTSLVDEIAFAMKSCFAGLYLDGFDFIQGAPWISSERSEDFIVAMQRFH